MSDVHTNSGVQVKAVQISKLGDEAFDLLHQSFWAWELAIPGKVIYPREAVSSFLDASGTVLNEALAKRDDSSTRKG